MHYYQVFKMFIGDGEVAQWLRALIALPEVLSSILSTHMAALNYLSWGIVPSSGMKTSILIEHSHIKYIYKYKI